jgi:structural maintenance of chromosome 3 (chondroitin sulfate proteoglycan 6)
MLDKKFTYVEPKTIQRDLEMKETQLETIINMLESSRNKLREKKLEVEQINLQLRMLVLSKNGDGSSRETMEEMKNFTSTEVDKIEDKNLQLKSENEELEAEIKEKIETLKNAENDSSRLHKDLKKLLIDYGNKRTTKESLENKLVNHKIDNVEARRKFNLDNENF